jgi:uncharacterized membrane protein YfcA
MGQSELLPFPPLQLALGAAAGLLVGAAKTGVPGLGTLVVPLMVLAVGDARQSAAWLLPMLCTADLFAVWYWRRHAEARALFTLAPWVVLGMAAGAAALGLHERALRTIVGTIVLAMLGAHIWRMRRPQTRPAHSAPYGVTAGFATTVANAAGPAMYLYLLSRRLPKEQFVATGAWFFFAVNLAKLPTGCSARGRSGSTR